MPFSSGAALMDESGFTPGVWRHYKGAEYLALGLAREDETDEVVVVYTRLYSRDGLPMSTRRLAKWNQIVEHNGRRVPRFEYVGQRSMVASPGAH
jgi:hypothetical protein